MSNIPRAVGARPLGRRFVGWPPWQLELRPVRTVAAHEAGNVVSGGGRGGGGDGGGGGGGGGAPWVHRSATGRFAVDVAFASLGWVGFAGRQPFQLRARPVEGAAAYTRTPFYEFDATGGVLSR